RGIRSRRVRNVQEERRAGRRSLADRVITKAAVKNSAAAAHDRLVRYLPREADARGEIVFVQVTEGFRKVIAVFGQDDRAVSRAARIEIEAGVVIVALAEARRQFIAQA